MEYLFIYGLQLANYITILAVIIFIIPLIIVVVFGAGNCDWDTLVECWNKWYKKTLIACIVIPLFLFALPTKQTLLLMGGTYLGKRAVNEVVNSDKLEKINTIIDLQLDKYIKELKGNNND